jgi:two-component system response regulator DesR
MIHVLLAEGMDMVRGAFVTLLDLEPDIRVICEMSEGAEILSSALNGAPDVAVIDIDLRDVDALRVAIEVQEQLPGCRTLMLASTPKLAVMRRAQTIGVGGLVLKIAPPSHLADSIRRVSQGQRAFDIDLTLAAWANNECPLTDRELEVLERAAAGDEVNEIARELRLSAGTVRNYLTGIVGKLNARNRIDAVLIASKAGWI